LLLLNLFSAGRRRETVPIFPLGTVLYPDMLLPLKIFEVRYVDMAKQCLKEDGAFGVCLIKEGQEVGTPAIPERVGCLAKIVQCDVEEIGILKVVAQGAQRFRLVETSVSRQGLVTGVVEPLAAEPEAGDAEGLCDCAAFLAKAIAGIGAQRFAEPLRFDDASWVGFRLAEILPLRNDVKQKLLELTDATLRLAVLHRFLKQQNLIG
jgi:Lon protease-like protein